MKLSSKVEGAEGPNYALECEIHTVVGVGIRFPAYTASIDAAIGLVPDGHTWGIFGGDGPDSPNAWVWPDAKRDLLSGIQSTASTPALALCAAALKARGL